MRIQIFLHQLFFCVLWVMFHIQTFTLNPNCIPVADTPLFISILNIGIGLCFLLVKDNVNENRSHVYLDYVERSLSSICVKDNVKYKPIATFSPDYLRGVNTNANILEKISFFH